MTMQPPVVRFLHRLDVASRQGRFVATSLERLREAIFLDGRTRFWDDETTALLPAGAPVSHGPSRFIFHVSFCGSTLLATLLDTPGAVLALKEPQVLVDASDWLNRRAGSAIAVSDVLGPLGNALVDPSPAGEAIVIKPSNWANNLVPHLCTPGSGTRAVFVSMPCLDFLRAVFRGGRERMAYTARATAHLAASGPAADCLQQAIAGGADPLDQMARIAALSHRLQEAVFRDAMAANGWSNRQWITLEQLVARPAEAALRAAEALDLQLDPSAIEAQVARRAGVHAKNDGAPFVAGQRSAEDRDVDRVHGQMLRRAAAWSAALNL